MSGLIIDYIVPFLIVLTILVFVHEWGHYWVARRSGVRVTVFSIGFGPELFGWYDSRGTRWKFSAIPLGGYVKMFGDADPASRPSDQPMTDEERAVAFQAKPLRYRAAIVAAGPIANFLFAWLVIVGLLVVNGPTFPGNVVGEVEPDSAAEAAGLVAGDRIIGIDGQEINRFIELAGVVRASGGQPLALRVERDDTFFELTVQPEMTRSQLADGTVVDVPLLGVRADISPRGPVAALWDGAIETAQLTELIVVGIYEIIVGERSSREVGGPIRIAQFSGEIAQMGAAPLIWFVAALSINLGLINLFPVPLLDGGHLVFYAAEALRGRPLSLRAQEFGFRIGLALVLSLMVFATWNDLVELRIVAFISSLFS